MITATAASDAILAIDLVLDLLTKVIPVLASVKDGHEPTLDELQAASDSAKAASDRLGAAIDARRQAGAP